MIKCENQVHTQGQKVNEKLSFLFVKPTVKNAIRKSIFSIIYEAI